MDSPTWWKRLLHRFRRTGRTPSVPETTSARHDRILSRLATSIARNDAMVEALAHKVDGLDRTLLEISGSVAMLAGLDQRLSELLERGTDLARIDRSVVMLLAERDKVLRELAEAQERAKSIRELTDDLVRARELLSGAVDRALSAGP